MADDLKSRYSIFVPSPKARINLGKPDLDAPFGYTGLSLQSDVHFLVDVNKVSMFQSGGTSCWQVGGKWLQWSNGPMHMSSTAAASFTASNKITIAAGAAQGQITALDHGLSHVTPRPVEYNNLDLHYAVEEVHNAVKAMFYGADSWKAAQKESQATQAGKYTDTAAPDYGQVGFLGEMAKFLQDQGYSPKQLKPLLQPLEWEGDHVNHHQKMTSDYNPIKAFDPYAPSSYGTWWLSKGFARFAQVVVFLQRTVDLLQKVGPLITDNMVGKRVQALISAWGDSQNALNNALNVADLARFDRGTGKAAPGGAWNLTDGELANAKARVPVDSPATAAELDTSEGPFAVDDVRDTTIQARSAQGGTPIAIDFADLLTLPPARIFLRMKTCTRKLGVSGAPLAAVVPSTIWDSDPFPSPPPIPGFAVDGKPVSYDVVVGAWGDLPSGFAWEGGVVGGAVVAVSGAPFAFSSLGAWVILAPDPAFADADQLIVTADGTSYSISLAAVVGNTAEALATALASAINAKYPNGAASNEDYVVISSTKKGPDGSISGASTKIGMLGAWVGASSAVGGGYEGTITADQLASKLSAVLTSSATTTADVVTLTHDKTGKADSYLELSGPLVSTFFGANPAISTGDDSASRVSGDFFHRLSDMRSVQYEMAKWPEDLRNQTRPLYEAVGDVAAVAKNIQSAAESLKSLVLGSAEAPKSIGLIAGGGITLGAKKGIFQTGKSVTIIATEEEVGPDEKKFLWKPEGFIYKAWKLQDDAQDLIDAKLTPKAKNVTKKSGLSGFRVISGEDVTMMAKTDMRLASIRSMQLDSKTVHLAGANDVSITSKQGGASIYGKTVVLGNLAVDPIGKRSATEGIYLRATADIAALTTKSRLRMSDGVVQIGKRKPNVSNVDTASAYFQLDVDAGTLLAGVGDANTFAGLSVPQDGKSLLSAKDELAMGVNSGAGIKVTSTEVSLAASSFKVGTSLLVKSDGKFSAKNGAFKTIEDTRLPKLKADFAKIKSSAATIRAEFNTRLIALKGLIKNSEAMPLAGLLSYGSRRKAVKKAQRQLRLTDGKLVELRKEYNALKATTEAAEFVQEVGLSGADLDMFVV